VESEETEEEGRRWRCASRTHTSLLVSDFSGTWEKEVKLPWREASPPDHHDDKVDSDH